jgi:hypothetical protein
MAKYGKCKEGKVYAHHVFLISHVQIFCLGQAVMALHPLHYQQYIVMAMLPC